MFKIRFCRIFYYLKIVPSYQGLIRYINDHASFLSYSEFLVFEISRCLIIISWVFWTSSIIGDGMFYFLVTYRLFSLLNSGFCWCCWLGAWDTWVTNIDCWNKEDDRLKGGKWGSTRPEEWRGGLGREVEGSPSWGFETPVEGDRSIERVRPGMHNKIEQWIRNDEKPGGLAADGCWWEDILS